MSSIARRARHHRRPFTGFSSRFTLLSVAELLMWAGFLIVALKESEQL